VAAIDADVIEVILGEEHLMSSLFTVGETELAVRGLAAAKSGPLRVLVGGLGLGYTARAALADTRVTSVDVVDALAPVIGQEPRCHLRLGDFFGWFDTPPAPGDRYDVVLLDIDHSPRALLHPEHARFYAEPGLRRLREGIAAGGVFAMWSDEGPDAAFIALLEAVFDEVRAEVVAFDNPLTGRASTCTIYVCNRA
jgi:spermidine synthase